MYKFALIELVDRYCIAKLKFAKLGNNEEELNFYTKQIHELDFELIEEELNKLYEIHSKIWDLEDDFKKCRVEHLYDLAEVGRRAIIIRDISKERYALKNIIADKLNDPIKERKKYYTYVV